MTTTIVEGFTLGLATGMTCLSTCTPIYLPFLMNRQGGFWSGFGAIMEISAGRFFSYLLFGAIAGYIGGSIEVSHRQTFTGIAYILLSFYMILLAVRTHRSHKGCTVPGALKLTQNGFLLGILTGINFCPSFLIALSRSIGLGGMVAGMGLFLGFFAGTTLFLIPLAFAAPLARKRIVRIIGTIAAVAIGVWFIVLGISQLSGASFTLSNQESIPLRDQNIAIISSEEHAPYFRNLQDSLQTAFGKDVTLLRNIPEEPDSNTVWFADETMVASLPENIVAIPVQPGYPIPEILSVLKDEPLVCPSLESGDDIPEVCRKCTKGNAPLRFTQESPDDARILDVFAPDNRWLVISTEQQREYFRGLRDSLESLTGSAVGFEVADPLPQAVPDSTIVFYDSVLGEVEVPYDRIMVHAGFDIQQMTGFLSRMRFRVTEAFFWTF